MGLSPLPSRSEITAFLGKERKSLPYAALPCRYNRDWTLDFCICIFFLVQILEKPFEWIKTGITLLRKRERARDL